MAFNWKGEDEEGRDVVFIGGDIHTGVESGKQFSMAYSIIFKSFQDSQLFKNRFCGLVVKPEVIDDIRSKRIIPKTMFLIQFWLLKFVMVNKTKSFQKLTPTS